MSVSQYVKQYLLTLPEHLRSPQFLVGFVLLILKLSMLCHVYYFLSVCLFSFLAIELSVYFRFMSLTVPLVSFVPHFKMFMSVSKISFHWYQFSWTEEMFHFRWLSIALFYQVCIIQAWRNLLFNEQLNLCFTWYNQIHKNKLIRNNCL